MALHILVKIESVHDNSVAIKKKVPQLFHRLATIEGEYEIHLKPDTIPHACSLHCQAYPNPLR